jgi:hypothetical protein
MLPAAVFADLLRQVRDDGRSSPRSWALAESGRVAEPSACGGDDVTRRGFYSITALSTVFAALAAIPNRIRADVARAEVVRADVARAEVVRAVFNQGRRLEKQRRDLSSKRGKRRRL